MEFKGGKAMKFVHIADLHLGKVIYQQSLLPIQKELLFELLKYMDEQDIRTLIIAGDVYDRYIPSLEAVGCLDDFLTQALLKYHIQVYMISGNHDSSDRMHFASSILADSGLHIETHLKKEMAYVEKDDIRFYMLPFVKPSQIKHMFDVDVKTYQEAIEFYLQQQTLDSNYHNILITHQFVGHSSIQSDSEDILSVGGSEILSASLFDDFEYVALGHLHAPQYVHRETIRYSGSLMRYSFDEVNQTKSITVVDTRDFSIELHELHPSMTLQKYKGTFASFMDRKTIENKNDYIALELEEDHIIPHAIDQLRILYPHLLQITYPQLFQTQQIHHNQTMNSIEEQDFITLFTNFYRDVKQLDLNSKQLNIIQTLLDKVGEDK